MSMETGRILYLVVLIVAIGSWFFVAGRKRIGQMAQHALLWALILIGVASAYGLYHDMRGRFLPQQSVIQGGQAIELPRTGDGHYYARVAVNGVEMPFMVDTGASDVVLTRKAAEAAGIEVDSLVYTGIANTANGQVRTAMTTLDSLALGPLVTRQVRVMVNDGDMVMPLLGMSYLNRFSRIEIAGGALRLEP